MTKYQVFRQVEQVVRPGGTPAESDEKIAWLEPLGEFDAKAPQGAVRAAVLAMPEAERAKASTQTFAACASSSWQVLNPTVNVETTVSFS